MSGTRNIGGVRIPELGGDASVTIDDYIMNNAPPKMMKIMNRRKAMMQKNLEEINDRRIADQQGLEAGEARHD